MILCHNNVIYISHVRNFEQRRCILCLLWVVGIYISAFGPYNCGGNYLVYLSSVLAKNIWPQNSFAWEEDCLHT